MNMGGGNVEARYGITMRDTSSFWFWLVVLILLLVSFGVSEFVWDHHERRRAQRLAYQQRLDEETRIENERKKAAAEREAKKLLVQEVESLASKVLQTKRKTINDNKKIVKDIEDAKVQIGAALCSITNALADNKADTLKRGDLYFEDAERMMRVLQHADISAIHQKYLGRDIKDVRTEFERAIKEQISLYRARKKSRQASSSTPLPTPSLHAAEAARVAYNDAANRARNLRRQLAKAKQDVRNLEIDIRRLNALPRNRSRVHVHNSRTIYRSRGGSCDTRYDKMALLSQRLRAAEGRVVAYQSELSAAESAVSAANKKRADILAQNAESVDEIRQQANSQSTVLDADDQSVLTATQRIANEYNAAVMEQLQTVLNEKIKAARDSITPMEKDIDYINGYLDKLGDFNRNEILAFKKKLMQFCEQ